MTYWYQHKFQVLISQSQVKETNNVNKITSIDKVLRA